MKGLYHVEVHEGQPWLEYRCGRRRSAGTASVSGSPAHDTSLPRPDEASDADYSNSRITKLQPARIGCGELPNSARFVPAAGAAQTNYRPREYAGSCRD